ncbi:deoxyribonuclease [Chamberlinius hualienensis]
MDTINTSKYCIVYFLILIFQCECKKLAASTKCKQKHITTATFNIQNLSPNKLDKPLVADTLKEIITRYDIILIQEVQDKSETVCELLKEKLNTDAKKNKMYDYVLSPITGRNKGEKEQFAVFYRSNAIAIKSSELYPDEDDFFTRDPFIVQVQFKTGNFPDMIFVNVHIKPDATSEKSTVKEISHLADVYEYIYKNQKIKNVMFMGDMNADGRYVVSRDWADISIKNNPLYKWLIGDDEDTTIGNPNNAYDRIIVVGPKLQNAIVDKSVTIFQFDNHECCIMTQNEALTISDHYPVEVTLKIC